MCKWRKCQIHASDLHTVSPDVREGSIQSCLKNVNPEKIFHGVIIIREFFKIFNLKMMLRQGIIQIAKVKVRNAKDRARLMVNGYSIVVASCVARVVLLYPQDP